jgi:NTP pyrophosphatase (non-canonical NTP hydrolase)
MAGIQEGAALVDPAQIVGVISLTALFFSSLVLAYCKHEEPAPRTIVNGTITPMTLPISFAVLRALNHERIASFGGQHTPAGLVACIAEEHGEVAACVLGLTGEKKRKEHLTVTNLGHELADVVTYCDLLADQYGIDLGEAVREKFNIVSARVGYGKVWQ